MCRGETISGSATAPALNRMPSALLKQSKDFRFFTLRRRSRPLSEIASAAGWADACEYCDSQSRAGRSLGARRPATAFASLRPPQATAREYFRHYVCGSLSRAVHRPSRRKAALSSAARTFGATPAAAEDKYHTRTPPPANSNRRTRKQDGPAREAGPQKLQTDGHYFAASNR